MEMLKLGETIQFGSKGNFFDFAGPGWASHDDTPGSTWTADHVATLNVGMLAAVPRIKMTLEAAPFLADGKISHQEMNIYLNGLWIGYVRSEDNFIETFLFPANWLDKRGENVFSFAIPTARVPAKIGAGPDMRCLGFAFQSLKFDPA